LNFVAPFKSKFRKRDRPTYVNTTSTSTKFSISIDQQYLSQGESITVLTLQKRVMSINKFKESNREKEASIIVQGNTIGYQIKAV